MQKGVWVEIESDTQPLSSSGALKQVFEYSQGLGVTDLYIQLLRSGKTKFLNALLPLDSQDGFDPLSLALELGARYAVRVHAWLNIFNLGGRPDAQVFSHVGEQCIQIDSEGRSIGEYADGLRRPTFQLDTPGLWIDPACEQPRVFFRQLVGELIANYRGLAGLHLDFFRYPYLLPIRPGAGVQVGYDFGYTQESLARFKKETGLEVSTEYHTCLAWDEWRRQQVTSYLSSFRNLLAVDQELSVASIPWSDRAYLSAFQDWRGWMEAKEIDTVLLMSYTADHRHFSYLVKQASPFRSQQVKLLAGIGCYRLRTLSDVHHQEQLALQSGADGVVLFSYGNLARLN